MKLNYDYDVMMDIVRDLFFNIHSGPGQFAVFGAGLFALLFFGKFINSWVGGSDRGVFGTSIGLLLPLVVGIAAFAFARMNVQLFIQDPEWYAFTCVTIGIVVSLFFLFVITPFFLGTGLLKSLVVFGLSVAAMLCFLYLTKAGVGSFDQGKKNVGKTSFYESSNKS